MKASRKNPAPPKYPMCDRKHPQEQANYICLTCKIKNLICTLCVASAEHKGHEVISLRSLLEKLAAKSKEGISPEQVGENSSVELSSVGIILEQEKRITESHLEILATLKLSLEEVSRKICQFQEKIHNDFELFFNKIKDEGQNASEVQLLSAQMLAGISDEACNPVELKGNVAKLMQKLCIQGGKIAVKNSALLLVNQYIVSANSLKDTLAVWTRESGGLFESLSNSSMDNIFSKVQITRPRPVTAIPSGNAPGLKLGVMEFTNNKSEGIVLMNDNKLAKVSDGGACKLVLLNISLMESFFVRLKLLGNVQSQFMFGIGIKQILKANGFKFKKGNQNHGTYLISTAGFQYRHGVAAQPCKNEIKSDSKQELKIQFDKEEAAVRFVRKNNEAVVLSLKNLPEPYGKDLYFCVGMSTTGDKIQIIGGGKPNVA